VILIVFFSHFPCSGVLAERNALLEGATAERIADGPRKNNDDLLKAAANTHANTTEKLKSGLAVLEATREQGRFTAAQLEEDREKIKRIDQGLDEVESELEISRKLITRFVKRVYTDKAILAFAFLLVAGIVGVIIYATLNPNQSIFNVPSGAIIPPIPGISTPSPSPSLNITSSR
jgi:Sec20